MTDLIFMGGNVKALGNGKVAGYLVVFGDETNTDLSSSKDFFTAQTDFGIEDGMKSATYYAHGLDPALKTRRLTSVEMKMDEVGVWVSGQLALRDEYEKAVYKMAEDGKLGWSSGTAAHLVTRKAIKTDGGTVHEILTWPLGLDASLTPTPAEPRAGAYTIKSLRDTLLGEHPAVATKSRADFTYDDLRALLEQEWNEDFPPQQSMYGSSYDGWERRMHIVAMDDATCVGQRGWDGELIRRAYTVTAGNDVTWGDPEEVARTTAFVAVTDGDAETDDTTPIAGKHADLTVLKQMLRGSMTFGDHADIALDAIEGFVNRAASLDGLAIKAGRAISAANVQKMKAVHAGMQTAHTAMAGHIGAMAEMIAKTDPDAKKDAEDFAALRTQFVRLQSELLQVSG